MNEDKTQTRKVSTQSRKDHRPTTIWIFLLVLVLVIALGVGMAVVQEYDVGFNSEEERFVLFVLFVLVLAVFFAAVYYYVVKTTREISQALGGPAQAFIFGIWFILGALIFLDLVSNGALGISSNIDNNIGIGREDLLLILLCPFAAAIGLFVSSQVKEAYSNAGSEGISEQQGYKKIGPVPGLVLGLVIALYFMGEIQKETDGVFKVIGFCILAGYQAPKLWVKQEKITTDFIDDKAGKLGD